jgi:hypothetical protein
MANLLALRLDGSAAAFADHLIAFAPAAIALTMLW